MDGAVSLGQQHQGFNSTGNAGAPREGIDSRIAAQRQFLIRLAAIEGHLRDLENRIVAQPPDAHPKIQGDKVVEPHTLMDRLDLHNRGFDHILSQIERRVERIHSHF